MRKIFYLITELNVGGAEKTLVKLAGGLDRRRFEPVVACLTGAGPLGAALEGKGIEVIHVNMRGWWDLSAWLRLRRELRERRPHVLHCFLFHANLAGRLAGAGLGIERVISSVRVEEPRLRHLWGDRLTRGFVDIYTCVSESARQFTHRRVGVALERIVVVPNAVAPMECNMSVLSVPAEWDLPEAAPVVAFVGRLDRQKDPLLLLRAAQVVIRSKPDAHFVFAGTGPMMAACKTQAAKMEIAANVRWLGWMKDLRPLYGRMDLLALSSRWEGMPNVALEAMACAKPVVATSVGGTPEVVEDGRTGYLVPWGDADALAERILRVLNDAESARQMGQAGRERAEERFSVKGMIEANEALYG